VDIFIASGGVASKFTAPVNTELGKGSPGLPCLFGVAFLVSDCCSLFSHKSGNMGTTLTLPSNLSDREKATASGACFPCSS
jgi:hypothetical protein